MEQPARPSRAVLFLAGDLSGDIYSAKLATEFSERNPGCAIHALGGNNLGDIARRTGGKWIADTTNCSAIGLHSVIPIYLWARWLSFKMRRFVRRSRIDAAVLCDWGGFNCRQLRFFKSQNIPLLYYFPPRSWQQGGNRRPTYAPHVRRVATPFAWSAKRLAAAGCRAEWVGHPILERAPSSPDRAALREEFGVAPNERLVALLPGSREPEIRIIGPALVGAAEILGRGGRTKYIVPVPPPLLPLAKTVFGDDFLLVSGRASDALRASDAAAVKTGSATLEAVVADVPQVTVYDLGFVGKLEWMLLWSWQKIPFIAMPNIILQKRLVSELIGLDCDPKKIAASLAELLDNPAEQNRIRAGYREIRQHLGEGLPEPASLGTAKMLEDLLAEEA